MTWHGMSFRYFLLFFQRNALITKKTKHSKESFPRIYDAFDDFHWLQKLKERLEDFADSRCHVAVLTKYTLHGWFYATSKCRRYVYGINSFPLGRLKINLTYPWQFLQNYLGTHVFHSKVSIVYNIFIHTIDIENNLNEVFDKHF